MTYNAPVITEARRLECELDGLYFTRYFMKQRTGAKMIVNRHHSVMQSALDRTMLPPDHPDFIPRLIINVPPGYTKTEMAAIHYMARGLAVNPRNRFLHLSYSSDLALQNSATTREIVKSVEFQNMWDVQTKDDMNSKKTWWTEQTGGIRAASARGQVTGFRAGHMEKDQFTGALIIDDPVKPEDAYSEVKRNAVNDGYNETVASRLAVETVPVIVIMQRIHHHDLSGYLLRGGSGEKWHHLNMPVIIDDEYKYPEENTHGIPIAHGLPVGWLWSYKHDQRHEAALRSHRRKWLSQYMQNPPKRESELQLWEDDTVKNSRFGVFDCPTRTIVSIDPAVSNTKTSDEHGITVQSKHAENQYTVDADYTRKGSPKQWATTAIWAYEKHMADGIVIETNQGGDMCEDTLRNNGYKGRIFRVHASKGKVPRSEPIVALYELGFVKHKPGLTKLEDEMSDLDPVTGLSNGRSPNRVDSIVWGLTELSGGLDLEELLKMAMGGG